MRLPLFVSRIAFHITRVCRMHACFAFIALVRLFVLVCLCLLVMCDCMLVLRAIVNVFAFVCCKVASQYTPV